MGKKTMIDAAKFEGIIRASGLQYAAQAGFVKVSAAAGRNLYVASTKRVGRVDLSGFEVADLEGIVDLGEDLSFGNVKQQLDFAVERTEDQILATFELVLQHMATLPPVEKLARKASAPKGPQAAGWSPEVPKAPTKEERKALLIARNEAHKASSQTEASAS